MNQTNEQAAPAPHAATERRDDVRDRLIDACTEQAPEIGSLMAEAASLLDEPRQPGDAALAPADTDVLSAMLWLYRRLPRGYGRQDHIEQSILALAARAGTDVAGHLAERGQPVIEKPMGPQPVYHGDRASLVEDGTDWGAVMGVKVCDDPSCCPRTDAAVPGKAEGAAGADEKQQALRVPLTEVIVEATYAAHATGRIALTFIDQHGVERPTNIAEVFVRHLVSIHRALQEAVEEDPPTGVSVAELAKLLTDLDMLTRWGHAGAAEVCRRAGDVIQRLLAGLSVSQLAPVNAGRDEKGTVTR